MAKSFLSPVGIVTTANLVHVNPFLAKFGVNKFDIHLKFNDADPAHMDFKKQLIQAESIITGGKPPKNPIIKDLTKIDGITGEDIPTGEFLVKFKSLSLPSVVIGELNEANVPNLLTPTDPRRNLDKGSNAVVRFLIRDYDSAGTKGISLDLLGVGIQ